MVQALSGSDMSGPPVEKRYQGKETFDYWGRSSGLLRRPTQKIKSETITQDSKVRRYSPDLLMLLCDIHVDRLI